MSVTGCPGWTDAGCAVKLTIRAGGTTRGGAWAAAVPQIKRLTNKTISAVLRMCAIIPKPEVLWIGDLSQPRIDPALDAVHELNRSPRRIVGFSACVVGGALP